jgi:hypothetical protein
VHRSRQLLLVRTHHSVVRRVKCFKMAAARAALSSLSLP